MIPTGRRPPAMTLAMLMMIGSAGMGFGGYSGRPEFAPGPAMPDWEPRPPPPPEPPKKQHQPVFTPKQKATRAKRKAARKARKR